jgi:sugar phosphate isomerase/epimerase
MMGGTAMQLGFTSAILADQRFEEVIDFAQANGFACVEMMCWPHGRATRRYAGVTHIDVDQLRPEQAQDILNYASQRGIAISALGYYPNPLDPDITKRTVYIEHIQKLILAAAMMGINRVTTFIGKDPKRTLEENFQLFSGIWPPLIALAEEKKVQIAIENCPMLFTKDEWPGGLNLATTPAVWRRMFEAIPSQYFGLNYDPSHLVWQQMDYIKPIYEFKDRIFHIHIKDTHVHHDKLDQVGIMALPEEYMSPKLPGQGDIDWGCYISALNDIRYSGPVCIEVEDKAYEDSLEDRQRALLTSRNYLNQFLY